MPLRLKRGLSAAFALAALAALMIHASVTSGCGSSSPTVAPEVPGSAATAAEPSAAPAAPAPTEETFFPASKAGPMRPHKSAAPPAQQQNASPQK